jgi:hypothetical protein
MGKLFKKKKIREKIKKIPEKKIKKMMETIKIIHGPWVITRARWNGHNLIGNYYNFKVLIENENLKKSKNLAGDIIIKCSCANDYTTKIIGTTQFNQPITQTQSNTNLIKYKIKNINVKKIDDGRITVEFEINFRYDSFYKIWFYVHKDEYDSCIGHIETGKVNRYKYNKNKRDAGIKKKTHVKREKEDIKDKIDKYERKILKLKKLIKKK